MAWRTLASTDNLRTWQTEVEPDHQVVPGSLVRFVVNLKLPLGDAFRLPGVADLFSRFAPDEFNLDRVDIVNRSTVHIYYRAGLEATTDGHGIPLGATPILPLLLATILRFVGRNWVAISIGGAILSLIIASVVFQDQIQQTLETGMEFGLVVLAIILVLGSKRHG